jgi:GNAT superfamily N-acetyltransferase
VKLRDCTAADLPQIFSIINDADRWHEPYMPLKELRAQLADGIVFSGIESGGKLLGVMGIQDKGEVALIRHAYVKTSERRKGIGEKLLQHLEKTTRKPVLIGTWRDAAWAIRFYEKNGYRVQSPDETARLLRKYWSIPERQIETSVVLAK